MIALAVRAMTNKPPFAQKQSLFAASDEVNINTPPASSPSSSHCSNTDQSRLVFPAMFEDGKKLKELHPNDSNVLSKYLHRKLDVSDINKIHQHLWIANQKRPPRALQHQILIGRRVVVVEDLNLHLLWIDASLFVKPLPDFLLCYDIWERIISREREFLPGAVGMLLSYIWLIRSKSDLRCVQIYSFCVRNDFGSDLLHQEARWGVLAM